MRAPTASKNLIQALACTPSERLPIWFMRQAGRYLPEYRKIREQSNFMEMCHTPELAAEITLQPLKRFDLDAAIIFSDILVTAEALGFDLDILEGIGPKISNPLTQASELQQLKSKEEALGHLGFVTEALKLVASELSNQTLLGFAGAPLTVASYCIESQGNPRLPKTFKMLIEEPESAIELMDRLAELTAQYLKAQLQAGAEAVQIFESWASLLPTPLYLKFALPPLKKIISLLGDDAKKVILFAKAHSDLWPHLAQLPVAGLSVGSEVELSEMSKRYPQFCLQGNLDPRWLIVDSALMEQEATRIVQSMKSRRGYIFNLGHGITPDVQPDQVARLIDAVRQAS